MLGLLQIRYVSGSLSGADAVIGPMTGPILYLLRLLLLAALPVAVTAAETAAARSSGLDAEAQAIKSEAIELISRIRRLEQNLLYPGHSRVAVYVSIAENSSIEPHSIRLAIDEETVAHHIYTRQETSALRSGGIQRLFTGNTTTGKHTLSVSLDVLRDDGSIRTQRTEYSFRKGTNASHIEIIVGGKNKPPVTIRSSS